MDFSQVALDKARALQERHDAAATCSRVGVGRRADLRAGAAVFDLVVLAYLQLTADERRRRCAGRSFARPGGTFFLVAHDSSNLTEGTGGPQDASVLFTAEEVLADLDGERFEVVRAGRSPAAGRRRRHRTAH